MRLKFDRSTLFWQQQPRRATAQNINGAGATFPYPIYSKWFSEYSQAHPNVKINYQSIGSGGGIRQVTEGTVDFGASDGPMTRRATGRGEGQGSMHIPDGARRGCADLQHARREPGAELLRRCDCGHLPGQDHEVERSSHRQGQPGREVAGQADPSGVSFGWQRHDLYLHRLSCRR